MEYVWFVKALGINWRSGESDYGELTKVLLSIVEWRWTRYSEMNCCKHTNCSFHSSFSRFIVESSTLWSNRFSLFNSLQGSLYPVAARSERKREYLAARLTTGVLQARFPYIFCFSSSVTCSQWTRCSGKASLNLFKIPNTIQWNFDITFHLWQKNNQRYSVSMVILRVNHMSTYRECIKWFHVITGENAIRIEVSYIKVSLYYDCSSPFYFL